MLRHFFFRVHSRVSRAQSDFKFVSASRRNQHASGVRSPEVAADATAATTKSLARARRLQLRLRVNTGTCSVFLSIAFA
jgi:hypothetical protein